MRRAFLALLVLLAGSLAVASAEEAHTPGETRGPFHRLWMVDLEGPIDAMQRAYLLRRFEAAKKADVAEADKWHKRAQQMLAAQSSASARAADDDKKKKVGH